MTTKILTGDYGATYTLSAPVTTLSITVTGYLAAGLTSAGVGAYSVVNAGQVIGYDYGVSLAGGGFLTNAGTVLASSTLTGGAVMFGKAGSVANTGLILGFDGVEFTGAAGAVSNGGAILATRYGVDLAAGGVVINGSVSDTTARIAGKDAVLGHGAAVTVANYGTMTGFALAGVYLAVGGSVTNGGGGDTTAVIVGAIGVAILGAAGTVANQGTIRTIGTTGAAVVLGSGGKVTNGSTSNTAALMVGAGGIVAANAAATVVNYGTIAGGVGTATTDGGVLLTAGGAITNGSAKDTTARITGRVGAQIAVAGGTIRNFGTIGDYATAYGAVTYGGAIINGSSADKTALIEGNTGVAITTAVGSVVNFGTIRSAGASAGKGVGVLMLNGGGLTNGGTTDTTALVTGLIAVVTEGGIGTVANFGTLGDAGALYGAYLAAGGLFTNGASTDTIAHVNGNVGLLVRGGVGTVRNFGTIRAGLGGFGGNAPAGGVDLDGGGSVTNGSAGDTEASISGLVGVYAGTVVATATNFGQIVGTNIGVDLEAGGRLTNNAGGIIGGRSDGVLIGTTAGKVSNLGTITAGAVSGVGVYLQFGGSLTNGSATNHAALIQAHYGVFAEGVATVTNFGVLQGLGGSSVELFGATSRLNAEAGSVFKGVIDAGSALVDVVGGTATATGIILGGKIEGAGTLLLDGGTSYFDVGTSLQVSKIKLAGAATTARVDAKLIDSRIWDQTAGTLIVDAGEQITFTGTANHFSGSIAGSGIVLLSGGSDTFSNLAISTTKTTISKAAVTFSGTVALTGTVSATSTSLVVAAGGATLTGGGELMLSNTATNSLHGASAAATLTNEATIRGGGHLGAEVMTLDNAGSGLIESGFSTPLTIDTGANTIINAGTIEALKVGVLAIDSAIFNTGTLATAGGTLIVNGMVAGAGSVHISGGEAFFASIFNEQVSFGSSGQLALEDSGMFTNSITGFSHTGTTSLALRDIASATATAKYSGTTASGILTVTDGTHTAHIHFTGNYTAAVWTLSADGSGGTLVVDPTAPKPAGKALSLVTAAAAMGASAAGFQAWHAPPAAAPFLLPARP